MIIDVLVAVDGTKLAQQVSDGSLSAGSAGNPTNLGAWGSSDVYIAMITQHGQIDNDQGGSELSINANSGDTVRWTMTTFGGNVDHTAYIYDGSFNPSSDITALTYFNMQNGEYLPSGSTPTANPTEYHNNTYVAQGTVIASGNQIQYNMSFVLVDNSNGNVIGHFIWDPFIQVSN